MHVIHLLDRFHADAQLVLSTGPMERYHMAPINLLLNFITL